jgi:Mg-chelatase subunit ChlD
MSADKLRLPALILMTSFAFATACAANDKSVMLVLDASGSMKSALPDGTSRMDAAKSAVAQLVATLPSNTKLAFRAYGHQSPQQQKNCKDSALLTPFDTVEKNRAIVIAKAMSLQPQGYTPITYSLTLAAQDMLQQEAASHVVVLVSDGKETCEADPCAAAKAMADADAKLVVHTIGAGVDEATRKQLQCIATAARGSYFDANSSVELAAVMGQAAQTEAVEMPEVKVVQKAAISQKSASSNEKAPTEIETGEIVKGRLGDGGTQHYWKLKALTGRYRVVLDAKIANDEHQVIQMRVHAVGSDGGASSRIIATNVADFRTRAAAWIDTTGGDLTLRVDNGNRIVDYWLAIFPEEAQIPVPYFVRIPTVQPIAFGKAASAALDPKPGSPAGAWYSIPLKAADYKITAEFKRTDGKNTNVQAYVDMFGEIGEKPNNMETRVCTVNEVATGATCSAKLVLAQDAQVLFRLSPNGDTSYKTTFKVEPIDE